MHEERRRIFITLKSKRIFSGTIEKLGKTSILIKDKFDEEIPISLDSIQHIEKCREKREKNEDGI